MKAYVYDNGFIHSKTVVIDEYAASVGSVTWDVRSFRLNFETYAGVHDAAIARHLKADFLEDLDLHSPITLERLDAFPWDKAFRQSIARSFLLMIRDQPLFPMRTMPRAPEWWVRLPGSTSR